MKRYERRPIFINLLQTVRSTFCSWGHCRREGKSFLRTPPVCYRIIFAIYIFLKRKDHCWQDSIHLWTPPLPWGWRRDRRFCLTFIVELIGILNGTALCCTASGTERWL